MKNGNDKSLESWIWDAACSIRGAKDAPKFKDYILPLIFTKRLCDVFDDELNRIAKEVGSRAKAFKLVKHDKKLVRFYLPLEPTNPDDAVWSVIRKLADKIGEQLTTHLRAIADENPLLKGIIDRVDFNATTHGAARHRRRPPLQPHRAHQREAPRPGRRGGRTSSGAATSTSSASSPRASGQSAGEFYTPGEVGRDHGAHHGPRAGHGRLRSHAAAPPACSSSASWRWRKRLRPPVKKKSAPLKLYGQEYTPTTWAMANMNMIIHDMEGQIEIGDTFKNPKFRKGNRLQTFDRVVANPMWNQTEFTEKDYDADELDRFPKGAGFPGSKADWGWVQHILASLKRQGRAAIVLDTGAASRGSGNANTNKEKDVRRWFVEQDLIEGVIYLPENLFYNTTAPGIILVLNKAKPKERKGKLFLLNASQRVRQGRPEELHPRRRHHAHRRHVQGVAGGGEILAASSRARRLRRTTSTSPPAATSTPAKARNTGLLVDIVDELESLTLEAAETDAALQAFFKRIGVKP